MELLALPYKEDCGIVMLLLKENDKLEFQVAELRKEVAELMKEVKMLKAYSYPNWKEWNIKDTVRIVNNYSESRFE